MASYSISGSVVICTGTDITSAGLASFLDSNSAAGTATRYTTKSKDWYIFDMTYYLQIGTNTSGPTASIWDISNEHVIITKASGVLQFDVYGKIQQGSFSTTSASGGSFAFFGGDQYLFVLHPQASGTVGGIARFYGSHVYVDDAIELGNYSEFTALDCDLEIDAGIDPRTNVGQTINVSRSRIHHGNAVGLKIFKGSSPDRTYTLDAVRVESCTYGVQPKGTVVVSDIELDTCTYHLVPNQDDCDVTFINPDFTTLRLLLHDANDITRIEFRYGLTITNAAGTALSGVSVRATDAQGSHRFDTTTNASGNPTSFSSGTLQNSTYAGETKTDRAAHRIRVRHYSYLWSDVSRTANIDRTTDSVPLVADSLVTQSTGTASAHTGISITDHGASPVSWNSKNWGITITGDLTTNASLTATDIWHYLKYHCSLTATFNGKSGLDWHPLMPTLTTTARSTSEYYATVIKGVRIIDDAGNPFPGITTMQSDDGTYYTPPSSDDITFAGLIAGGTLKVFETGTTTELFSDTNCATSETWASASGTFDYTYIRDGYIPIRATGEVVSGDRIITLSPVVDRAFVTPSGLTWSDIAVDTTNKYLKCNIASTVQNFYSLLVQSYRSQSTLANKAFPMQANGPNSFTLLDGWETRGFTTEGTGIANTTLSNFSRDGLRYVSTSNVRTAVWAAILTSGVPAGEQVRYRQADAGTTQSAVNTGNMDELIQVYGDSSHGSIDYTGFLTLKCQAEGYDQAESDAYGLYGTLEDQLYVVGLAPTPNGLTTGDPSLATPPTISIGSYTEDGKTFTVKIVDGATANTGAEIAQWLRYNFEQGGTFQTKDAFCWHDLVQKNGSKFKTVNGYVYDTKTLRGVLVYQNDGTTLHPDFDVFTADNGDTYAVPVFQYVAVNGIASGYRVQIYDTTNSEELANAISSGASYTWTDSVAATGDRDIRIRISYCTDLTAIEFIEVNAGTCGTTESTKTVTYLANPVTDSVYVTNGVDGTAVTGVTFTDTTVDVINIDLTLPVDIQDIYAAWVYYAFTETGIASDIDYIEAVDIANYILSNLIIKNTTSPSVPLKLVGGYFWDATTGDPMDCIDTTGGTIFLAPPHVVPKIVSTSSSVVEGTPATVAAAVLSAAQATPIYADIRKVNNYTVDGDGQTGSEWGPA